MHVYDTCMLSNTYVVTNTCSKHIYVITNAYSNACVYDTCMLSHMYVANTCM